MFKKSLMILIFAGLAAGTFAAEHKKTEPELEPLERTQVIAALTSINQQINSPDQSKAILSITYACYSSTIYFWLKQYPFIEADTGIEKSWFEQTAKMLDYMGECKDLLERLKDSRQEQSEEYLKTEADFKEAAKRFAELVKNPTLVEHSKLERLRAEKAKWEAQRRREKDKKAGE